jgi:uncharacterized protein involved in outer membrane biogenesis
MGKKLKKVFIVIAVLFAAWILFYSFFAPGIVLRAARSAGSSALGSEVGIRDIRFSLLRKRADVKGIEVSNVEGFEAENIITADRVFVSFSPSSFLSSTLKFKEINISGVDIFIQQKGGKNNILKFSSRISSSKKPEGEPPGKNISAELVKVEGIVIHVDADGKNSSLRMDPIILENISTAEDAGAGEIFARVFGAVVSGALKQLAGSAVEYVIPEGTVEEIKSGLEESVGKVKGVFGGIEGFLQGGEE